MADQWSKHLAEQGYTGIALPSPEFDLLTLVFEHHGARGHQDAFDQLAPGVAKLLPAPKKNVGLPTIAGERTRSLELGVGLQVLSGLISALGGGTLGLDLGFKSARKLTFAYDGITSETLNAVALQQALGDVRAPSSGLLRDWLGDHLMVVTSVLRARKITVNAHSDTGISAKLDVPVISNAVGASLSVKTEAGNDAAVTFEGTEAVPFAVKLFQVIATGSSGQQRLSLRSVKDGSFSIKTVGAGEGIEATDEEEESHLEPTVLDWAPEREIDEAKHALADAPSG
jgi:hypothetical protein